MALNEVERIIWKQPQECTAREIDLFVALASRGDEVDEADIRRGTLRAKYLLWNERGEGFLAVAALKNPNPGYRLRVFQKPSGPPDSGGPACTSFISLMRRVSGKEQHGQGY